MNAITSINSVLITSVGGSHQPIISAIQTLQPDYVVFICTDKDPATGRPGSLVQITGKGNCIKATHQDEKPTLPAIPEQAGLGPEQFGTVCTGSDDLDRIYVDCTAALSDVMKRFTDATIFADYTGGTKSMSAGLAMAALEFPKVQLQLVTGSRSDLLKVHDGSQYSACANIEQIRFQRKLEPFRHSWSRYAYSEAEVGLKHITVPQDSVLRAELIRFRDLSRAFAAWDNFDHQQAQQILQPYAPSLGTLSGFIGILMRLQDRNHEKQTFARLLDLYLNALRRAEQGRYDDAIARIYRLIEWSAQWLLKKHCDIETADIQQEAIPKELSLSQNSEGKYQAGLYVAWQLVKIKTQGPAADFMQRHDQALLNHIKIRNHSILAHGFTPITSQQWQQLAEFMRQTFIPMLLEAGGMTKLPNQLPTLYS